MWNCIQPRYERQRCSFARSLGKTSREMGDGIYKGRTATADTAKQLSQQARFSPSESASSITTDHFYDLHQNLNMKFALIAALGLGFASAAPAALPVRRTEKRQDSGQGNLKSFRTSLSKPSNMFNSHHPRTALGLLHSPSCWKMSHRCLGQRH